MIGGLVGLTEHRTRIVDQVLVAIAVFAVPTYILNVSLAWRDGELVVLLIDTVAFLVVTFTVLFRRRLPLLVKAWTVPVVSYGIGMYLQVVFGPVVGGWTWLATFPVMAAVLIGLRAAFFALGVTVVSLLGIGVALSGGLLNWPTTAPDFMTGWLVSSVNFTLLAGIMSLSVGYLLASLRRETAERHTVEEERSRLALAVEQAPAMVLITDRAGTITYVNPAFTRTSGWHASDAVGRSLETLDLLPPEPGAPVVAALLADEAWRGEVTIRRRDGSSMTTEAMFDPLRDDTGLVTHHVVSLRDMTREAELSRQLQQTQKLEAIGTLAGGIAHDFNNLLLPILANADQAARELPDGHPARQAMDDVTHSAQRARELVRRILTFSRLGESERQPTDLVALVREVGQLLRATLPSPITLDLDLPGTPMVIRADESELHQVIMNLATNAWHAMRAGGAGVLRMSIAAVTETTDARLLERGLSGPWIRLEVTDTGVGMTPEVLARAFDPFFTTKPVGEGTGLGLATVHGAVMNMDGVLTISSTPGVGTVVAVFFHPSEIDLLQIVPAEIARPAAGIRILAVDDEPMVLRALDRLGTRLGHRIDAVADPRVALARLEASPNDYDLVFTDLTMPGMTGLDLARAVRLVRPDVPIVLATGYLEADAQGKIAEAGIGDVIVKPFAMKELEEVIRRAMARVEQ
ncbi:MAG: response regulator [Gemmatimonadales bacterium]